MLKMGGPRGGREVMLVRLRAGWRKWKIGWLKVGIEKVKMPKVTYTWVG